MRKKITATFHRMSTFSMPRRTNVAPCSVPDSFWTEAPVTNQSRTNHDADNLSLSLSEEGTSFLSQQTFWHWAGVNNEMYVPEPRCFTCVGWTRSSLMISVTPVSFHSAWYVRMSAVKRRKKTLGYLDVLPPLMCCSFFLFSLTFYVHGPVDVNKNRWRENTTRIGLHERRSVAVKKKKKKKKVAAEILLPLCYSRWNYTPKFRRNSLRLVLSTEQGCKSILFFFFFSCPGRADCPSASLRNAMFLQLLPHFYKPFFFPLSST